ncbi:hypothetical protein ACOMHN_045928 [Nucella lapillus]
MTDRRRIHSARTEDTYNYSDDFSDEDPGKPVKSAPEKQRIREFTYASEVHSFLRSGGRGGRNQGKGRGRGRGQGRNSQARSDTHVDVVTKQLLSANRLKMNELQNQVEDMKQQMKEVTEENKLFKRMQYKQERALVKFEDRESELPQLIQAHNNEIRTLRDQLRRTREKYEKTDRYLRDAEDELERVNTKCKKYKSVADQKDLAERSDLDRRLNKAELSIEEKECRIREIERHMENLKKNHRHELGIERARGKETQRQLDEIKDTNSKLETVLREKERQLDAQNIYSNRLGKPSSYNGTPAESPAPWRQGLKKKSESMSDLAPRDKARAYEEKRKTVVEKKKEKLRLPKLPLSPKKQMEKPVQSRPEKPVRSQEPKQKWEEESREKDQSADGPNFTFNSYQREDSDFWRRQEQRSKQDKDNREKQEEGRRQKAEVEKQEQALFQQQREKLQQDMEERERRERERRERERREADERELQEKEKKERERRDAEQQEKERKEAERRVTEERERLDNDPRLLEERLKKNELLRRLQQLDGNRDGSQQSSAPDPFAPSEAPQSKRGGGGDQTSNPFAPSPSRKADKDPFAPSPNRRAADKDPLGPSTGESTFSSPSSRKDYAFPRSIENMHKGKPSHEDPYIDRQKRTQATKDDKDAGGYQPSFSGSGRAPSGSGKKKTLSLFDDDDHVKPTAKPAEAERKSKLMADLFGSQPASSTGPSAKKKEEEGGEDFFLTSKSPSARGQQAQPKKSPGFPWDGATANGKTNGTSHRESSTLFGGGAALVDDDVNGGSGPKSTMLPKRSRQTTTTAFSAKPAMVAVDDLDDDIEEVVL